MILREFPTFNALRADWLCDYSALAYDGQVFEGEETVSALRTKTFASVSRYGDGWVLAFRGTACNRNWLTDIDARKIAAGCFAGRIHHGFYAAWKSVAEKIMPIFDTAADVWVTGHSLGGALAILAAFEIHALTKSRVLGVYTFGQPRVGTAEFASCFNYFLGKRTYRLVHANDVVPRVPWLLGSFRHAGHEVFYPAARRPMLDPSPLRKLPYDLRNAARELCKGDLALLADHHISTYQALFGPAHPSGTKPLAENGEATEPNAAHLARPTGDACRDNLRPGISDDIGFL